MSVYVIRLIGTLEKFLKIILQGCQNIFKAVASKYHISDFYISIKVIQNVFTRRAPSHHHTLLSR